MGYEIKVANSFREIKIPESYDNIMTRYLGPRGFHLYNGQDSKETISDLIDVIREMIVTAGDFELSMEEELDYAADTEEHGDLAFPSTANLVLFILKIIETLYLDTSVNGIVEVR